MGELRRSRDNKMVSGVLAGIAKQYKWDLSLLRLLFAGVTIFSAGILGIFLYIVAVMVIPEEDVITVQKAQENEKTQENEKAQESKKNQEVLEHKESPDLEKTID